MKKEKKFKLLHVRFTEDDHAELKAYTAKNRLKMQEYIESVVIKDLKKRV